MKIALRSKAVCPHCWEIFAPEESRWVATHPTLLGDPRLGDEASQRFLPTRFDANAMAIDAHGSTCEEIACPSCHLTIPRVVLETSPLFISVAGTPSCGKSYFLASAVWQLRQLLPGIFRLDFADADPLSNRIINHYEEQQFLNPNRDAVVRLAKTEEQGDLYHSVSYNNQVSLLPNPFLFSLRPSEGHLQADKADRVSRLLCLYDNAGESFLPGRDSVGNQVTRHLTKSHAILFLYDPTQDVRFREEYQKHDASGDDSSSDVTARQETVLHEISSRFAKLNLDNGKRRKQPLIIVLTKYDRWWPLLGNKKLPDPWVSVPGGQHALNLDVLRQVSDAVQQLVARISPELATAAKGFSDSVWYLPISATGGPPVTDPQTGLEGFCPQDVQPMWAAVPMLLAISLASDGLVPAGGSADRNGDSQGDP